MLIDLLLGEKVFIVIDMDRKTRVRIHFKFKMYSYSGFPVHKLRKSMKMIGTVQAVKYIIRLPVPLRYYLNGGHQGWKAYYK